LESAVAAHPPGVGAAKDASEADPGPIDLEALRARLTESEAPVAEPDVVMPAPSPRDASYRGRVARGELKNPSLASLRVALKAEERNQSSVQPPPDPSAEGRRSERQNRG
jgi:hypothetical protein